MASTLVPFHSVRDCEQVALLSSMPMLSKSNVAGGHTSYFLVPTYPEMFGAERRAEKNRVQEKKGQNGQN